MSDLYLISDYVFCDYGGSIFSSVYLNKNILLMNNKNFSDEKSLHQSSVTETVIIYLQLMKMKSTRIL